jgi:hypothetical protein
MENISVVRSANVNAKVRTGSHKLKVKEIRHDQA